MPPPDSTADAIVSSARDLRWEAGGNFHDTLMESIYTDAARIADRAVSRTGEQPRFDLDRTIDGLVTSRWLGFPMMLLMLGVVFWITIEGANVPSAMLATLLIGDLYPVLRDFSASIGLPWWMTGLLVDGMYLAGAWVVPSCCHPWPSSFPCLRFWKTSATSHESPSTSTTSSGSPARTASRPSPWPWGSAAMPPPSSPPGS